MNREGHRLPGLYHLFDHPIKVISGYGCYLYDDHRSYLDLYNNVQILGYTPMPMPDCPCINSRFDHGLYQRYTARLLEFCPPPLNNLVLVNSGSEAVDLALRLCQLHRQGRIGCLTASYHGTTMSSASVSTCTELGTKTDWDAITITHQTQVLNPDEPPQVTPPDHLIHETIQGVSGNRPVNRRYLENLYHQIHTGGGWVIADEIQTGFGRTGKWWSFQHYDLNPDIMVIGKPMGNGYPLAGVVFTDEVAETFNQLNYFNTFGGNSHACFHGLYVIDQLIDLQVCDRARELHRSLIDKLSGCTGLEIIGMGLFLGLVCPFTPGVVNRLVIGLLNRGYIVGSVDNIVRVKPPMIITADQLEQFAIEFSQIYNLLFSNSVI